MEETTTTTVSTEGPAEGPAELSAGPADESAHGADHGHPSPAKYVGIAVILAVVTGIEVGLYYIDMADGLLVVLLLSLALLKFVMVAAYFMHLKFDSRVLRRLFVTGIILAGVVYLIALLTLGLLV